MLTSTLRRSGGSLILTIPQSYAEQNRLAAGSKLDVEISGTELRLKPLRKRKTLAQLLDATPPGLLRADDWDEMPVTGAEL